MSRTHIRAEIPEDATPAEKREIIAGAYKAALSMASEDVDIRLRMILGEANERYEELARWIWQQIEAGETKAPGLVAFAEKISAGKQALAWLMRGRGAPDGVLLTEARLLERAVAESKPGYPRNDR